MPSRIAICLYEESVDNFSNDLIIGDDLVKVEVKTTEFEILLFQRKSEPTVPEWVEIVKNIGELNDGDLTNSSSGAILLVKLEKRVVACCFGSSVANINRNYIVNDFGLGVAFQRILKRNIKSIESFTLSTNPITNNRSAAIPTTQNNFHLDTYLENITELSGFFLAGDRNILIKGKEFFSTPSPLSLEKIVELCSSLLSDYHIASNDDNYKRITSTKRVKNKRLIEVLNHDLCKKIQKRDPDIFLIDFELLQDITSYQFTPKGDKLFNITIEDFYSSVSKGHQITIEYLRDRRIYVVNVEEQSISWSLYKCLFCELKFHHDTFILYKGNWYQLESSYLEGLRDFLRNYEVDNMSDIFPEWNGIDDEGQYNLSASKEIGGQCWDKILYGHPDFNYRIEFCDILTNDFIVHVKKYKSSALNSHLLLQTAVSAQLLASDPKIKGWIKTSSRKHFKKNILLKRNNEFINPGITYLIALMKEEKSSLADSLPFFSLVSFNLVIKKIIQLGFDVRIGLV